MKEKKIKQLELTRILLEFEGGKIKEYGRIWERKKKSELNSGGCKGSLDLIIRPN